MSERASYAPGTPCWVDLGSTDLARSHAFYGGLFGWDHQDAGPVELTGGYGYYSLRGKVVAGYGPSQDPDGGVWWTTYVSVDDVDATVATVEANGGTVLLAPVDVMTQGRLAVLTDPTGATFSVWQPAQHHGAQIVNEPGALSWNELLTRDLPAAKAFYQAVFGWVDRTPEGPYAELVLGDAPVAGAMAIPPELPADVPPHWNVYFAVDDVEAGVAKVVELGGQVRQAPMAIDGIGRAAIVGGPHHEGFTIIELTEPQ